MPFSKSTVNVRLAMAALTDTELRMIAEVVTECARYRGTSLSMRHEGIARAAVIDRAFRARLADVHERLERQRAANTPPRMLASIALLFRDLEQEARWVLDRPRNARSQLSALV